MSASRCRLPGRVGLVVAARQKTILNRVNRVIFPPGNDVGPLEKLERRAAATQDLKNSAAAAAEAQTKKRQRAKGNTKGRKKVKKEKRKKDAPRKRERGGEEGKE